MKSRFEPDIDSGLRLPPSVRLIDPEAYDASEQRFAASVEEKSAPPRFVLDAVQESSGPLRAAGSENAPCRESDGPVGPAEDSIVVTERGMVAAEATLQADFWSPRIRSLGGTKWQLA